MLVIPDSSPVYRVLSIDPGTDTLGLALLEVNLETKKVVVPHARTFSGDRMSRRFGEYIEVHGEKAARLYAHEVGLTEIMELWLPHAIICESPFLGRFPQAFAALVECLVSIRRAVYNYDRTITLETVDPPTAKKSVGVVGKGTTKEDVKNALKRLDGRTLVVIPDLDSLDEHSIDAIAVGYHKCQQFML